MKYAIIFTGVLAVGFTYAAEKPEKTVTIFNLTSKKISVDFDSAADLVTPSFIYTEQHTQKNIESKEIKTFNLIEFFESLGQGQGKKKIPTLIFDNVIPRLVRLNLKNNNVPAKVVIAESDDYITVSGSWTTNMLQLPKAEKKSIVIGNQHNKLSISYNNTQQITIQNKDLAQVVVVYQLLGLSSPYGTNEQFPIGNSESCKNNHLVEDHTFYLREQWEQAISIPSFHLNPHIIHSLIRLIIPQAIEEVFVNIDEQTIKSGDTLEVSLSETDKMILVSKISGTIKEVIARLHSYNKESLTVSFDEQ